MTSAGQSSAAAGVARVWRQRLHLWTPLLLALGVFLQIFPALAEEANRGVNAASVVDGSISLTEYLDVLEDPTASLSIADMQKPEVAARFKGGHRPEGSINLGLTSSTYWLRLRLDNSSMQALDQFVEIAYARLAHIDFYSTSSGVVERTIPGGYFLPFAQRAYPHHFFVYPVSLQPRSEKVIYFKIASPVVLEIPARLWSPASFHAYERNDYMLNAAYVGIVAAMLLFNLLLFVSLRDRQYVIYVLFILCTALAQTSATGIAIEYLWDGMPTVATRSLAFISNLGGLFFIVFARHMIGTAQLMPRFDRVLKGWMVFNVLTAISLLFVFLPQLSYISVTLVAVLVFIAAVIGATQQQRSSGIFLAAFIVFLVGAVLSTLRQLGLVSSNFVTVNATQLGSALEMIVLAFALADRFNTMRAEREKAQIAALKAEQRVVETLRTSERLLEARVAERTAELSATVLRLQKTQSDLVQAEKLASLGSLVAGVAHELNTPIGTALTTASTLDDNSKQFQQAVAEGGLKRSTLDGFLNRCIEMSELLVRSCHRAANLISSFKQVAVDQTSEQQRQFNLLALVRDNIAALRPNLRGVKWTIEIDVPDDIDCNGYPGPLGQVLVNLVQNAGVHAFDGRESGCLRITASTAADMVELVISDDGSGMNAETLTHIFDPFFTTKLGKGGSGLGLSICLNIVTGVLGGTLRANSTPGVGSTFTVSFPLVVTHKPKPGGALLQAT